MMNTSSAVYHMCDGRNFKYFNCFFYGTIKINHCSVLYLPYPLGGIKKYPPQIFCRVPFSPVVCKPPSGRDSASDNFKDGFQSPRMIRANSKIRALKLFSSTGRKHLSKKSRFSSFISHQLIGELKT